MGGYGSGGHNRMRSTAESWRSIDAAKLARHGCLRPGFLGGWQWTDSDGHRTASVNLSSTGDSLHLSYRVRGYGDEDWQDVEEDVPIIWEPCCFGGQRAFFLCPGVVNGRYCGRRVLKLYGAARYFLCRHCYRLTYASRQERPFDRALRRANKIRRRLGGDPGTASPFPQKPKGMHWSTYERLRDAAFEAEMDADDLFVIGAQRLLQRLNRRRSR